MNSGIPTSVCLLLLAISVGAQTSTSQVYKPGDGASVPKMIKEVKPVYPAGAMAVGIEGAVTLECIVNTDGSVSDVRVTKPLYSLIDEASAKALQQWRFEPAMKDGKPVRAIVEVEMTFATTRREPRLDSPGVYKIGVDGVTGPTVMVEVKPSYTQAARDAGIQGIVTVESVIQPDGSVGDLRVTKPLDPGLDVEAVNALRKWKFSPATKGGKPVPVQVFVELTFTLK